MVRTEVDMVVNQFLLHHINHHHINRGYVNLHLDNNVLILNFHGDYIYIILLMMSRKMLTSSTNMQTMVGEANFLILFVTKEDTQILMSLGSLLLMGVLILSP